jgi:hypothetical protein
MNMRKLLALGAAGALALGVAGTTLADPTYATVDGHAAFSAESNDPGFWGDDCSKLDAGQGDLGAAVDSYVLTADYAKVIVKAGSGENANTIFEDVTAGETVWADTNGNNTFDPGGQDGDKNISHIIFCGGPEATPSFEQSQEAETDAPTPSFDQSQEAETDQPTQPSTDTIGSAGTSGPADGAWLLVVALGVILASVVVLTPARAKNRS